jgi:adenylate cyclase
MTAAAGPRTRTAIVAVPFDRAVRLLHDPDTLVKALAGVDAEASFDRVLGVSGEASSSVCNRVTVMFGDVEGFTPLTERLGDQAAAELVGALDSIFHAALAGEGGHRVKSAGDGFMAAFIDPAEALRCARSIQWSLIELAQAGLPVRMRMGVHTGPVVRIRAADGAHDVVGRTVNLASRISNAARGGEVLVSSTVRRGAEPLGEFCFQRERRLRLKGLAGLHHVAELAWRGSR